MTRAAEGDSMGAGSGNGEGRGATSPSPLLVRLGLHRRELRAWALYDWANSAFVTTMVAAVFPAFYAAVAAQGLPEGGAETRYTAATFLAIVVAAILSPILGAIADFRPWKKRFLAVFLLLGATATGMMFFLREGDWLPALVLFGLGNLGAMASYVFYDALLPHVAREDELDRVSTAGYAIGYIGGGLLLALNVAWITAPAIFGLPSGDGLTPAEATLPVRLAFLSVAVWWLLFSIPLFLHIREPELDGGGARVRTSDLIRVAFSRVASTFREIRQYREAAKMLVAYLIYADGIGTIIRMAVVYGTVIGIDQTWMIVAILITQFVGVPCAFGFGALAGRIGARRAIFLGLVVYAGISVLGFLMTTHWHFLALAVLVGMVQGGTQALSRSLFASMVPVHKTAEFFGFYGVMDRFSGSIGSGLLGIMVAFGISIRYGILAVILFFVAGGAILLRVRVEEGVRVAKAATERARMEAGGVGGGGGA
jgi:MFS transporter, UMF1 family